MGRAARSRATGPTTRSASLRRHSSTRRRRRRCRRRTPTAPTASGCLRLPRVDRICVTPTTTTWRRRAGYPVPLAQRLCDGNAEQPRDVHHVADQRADGGGRGDEWAVGLDRVRLDGSAACRPCDRGHDEDAVCVLADDGSGAVRGGADRVADEHDVVRLQLDDGSGSGAADPFTSLQTTYQYNPDGQLSQQTLADGRVTAYTYDSAGRLVQANTTEAGQSPLTFGVSTTCWARSRT